MHKPERSRKFCKDPVHHPCVCRLGLAIAQTWLRVTNDSRWNNPENL